MCDISFTRKAVVLVLLKIVLAEPQLDIPPHNDLNYRRNNPDFQRNNPDFQRTNPDYQRTNPDYQRANPDYQRTNPDYQNRGQDFGDFNRRTPQDFGYDVNRNDGRIPGNPEDPRYEDVDRNYRGDIRQLLQDLDLQASQQCTNNVAAQWNFETNVNQGTQLEAVSVSFFNSLFYFHQKIK